MWALEMKTKYIVKQKNPYVSSATWSDLQFDSRIAYQLLAHALLVALSFHFLFEFFFLCQCQIQPMKHKQEKKFKFK